MIEQGSQTECISKYKEYYCQMFADLLTGHYNSSTNLRISFPTTSPNKQLPKFYRDHTVDKIYLLKWTENNTKYGDEFLLQLLDLSAIGQVQNKTLQKSSKTSIDNKLFPIHRLTFNNRPEQIAIVSDYFFAIGGQTVTIQSISPNKNNFQTVTQTISYECIETVCGFLSQNNNPSILIYTKDSKDKLSCHTVSLYSDNSKWLNKIKNYFTNKPRKIQNYSELRVLVPGVLGIIFFNNKKSFSLINLNNFQFVPNTYYELAGWQIQNINNVKVRYQKGDEKINIYDDNLTICIAQSNFMELFTIKLKIREDKNIPIDFLKKFHIMDFPYQELIDWENCSINGIITYCHGEQFLQDIQFVKNGIVVCGYKDTLSKIPRYSFYAAPHFSLNTERNVIISHQWNLWSDYLQQLSSKKNYQNIPIEDDELLKSNKYPIDFILWSTDQHYIPENKIQMLNAFNIQRVNHKKLLYDWLREFRVLKLISYKGEFLILRRHSISVLLPISQLQHKTENLQLEKITSELSMKRQIVYSNYDRHGQQLQMMGQELAERESQFASDVMSHLRIDYSDLSQDHIIFPCQSLSKEQKLEMFYRVCQDIYSCIYQYSNNNYASFTIPEPKYSKQFIYKTSLSKVLSNRIKDILLFYNKIVTADILSLEDTAKSQLPMRPFISLLEFYSTILNKDLQQQFKNFGGDIIDKFIQSLQKRQLFTGDLQIDIHCCLGRLFQRLVPFKMPSIKQFQDEKFQNKDNLAIILENIQNQICISSQLPTFNHKQQIIEGQNSFLDFLFFDYLRGNRKYIPSIVSKFIWIMQKHAYEPVNFSILRVLYIGCISQNSQQNQMRLKKYLIKYLIDASQHSKRTQNDLQYQSKIIDNIMNLLGIQLPNSAQICSKIQQLLIMSFPNLLCSYYFQIQNQKPLLKSIGKDTSLKKMLLDTFRESLTSVWNQRRKKQDIRQIFKIRLDELDTKVQNKIQKLKLLSDEEELIQYLSVVFEARCQLFNYRFGFKDRGQLLKLLEKCQKSYIQLLNEYKSIYGWQLQCQSQNIQDIDEQKIFFDRIYSRQKITLLGKLPTTIWVKIISNVLEDENFDLNTVMDKQDTTLTEQNKRLFNTIEMNSPQMKIGYYYLWKIITTENNNILALDELIQIFGRCVIDEWICIHMKFLQAYVEKTTPEFKARLKYVNINRQLRERFRTAAKQMPYRNAVIETIIDQIK